jgi:predicted dehydrogenase
MSTPKVIRWGILGPGKIARKFAEDLRGLPGASIHAVASMSRERADAFAADFGVPNVFYSYEDLARCPGLDIVYVATPHVFHFANTMLCLEHGVAVLCEKPFAMNLQEATEMCAKAREKGVFLMEALWSCFVPGVQRALEIARSGALGPVKMVRADLGFFNPYQPDSRLFDPALGGGALLDIGIYPLWLALTVFGKPTPEQITASASFSPSGSDETCAFSIHYPGGQVAIGHATVAATTPLEAHIFGEKGMLRLHPRWHHTQALTLSMHEGKSLHNTEIAMPHTGWGYTFEAIHVMECLRAGLLESPLWPLQSTLDLAETLDTILLKFEKSI